MIKNNQKNYWNKFYKIFNLKQPSNFSRYVIRNNFITKRSSVLEIGCGNGRDTFYFIKNKIKIISFDNSLEVINKNKKIINNVFFCYDVSKLTKKNIDFFKKKKINLIYGRFFLHTLTEKNEDLFFKFATSILETKGKIILEFRTTKDPLIKKGKKISHNERITDHYRRFIDSKLLIQKLELTFKPIFKLEKFGLARYKNENPHVCRLVLQKL